MRSRRKSIANISRGIDPVRLRRNNNAQTAGRFRRGLRRTLRGDVVLDERFVVGAVNSAVATALPSLLGSTLGGGEGGGGGGGGATLGMTFYTSAGDEYIYPLAGTFLAMFRTSGMPYSIPSGSGVVRYPVSMCYAELFFRCRQRWVSREHFGYIVHTIQR